MITFTARTTTGLGLGTTQVVPTVNLCLEDIPTALETGIYACFAGTDAAVLPAALHYGPRPAVQAGPSCEVHFIDRELTSLPEALAVNIVARLRDVEDFSDVAALKAQIAADIAVARAILGNAEKAQKQGPN